jgi:NAD(P)-dependent dehydrogenase (short-subunit alcohol dehydrogenase family)
MNTQKVAIITGASRGIGAALVTAYRKLGYAVVANSRSIAASGDPEILTVPGDLAEPGAGARVAAMLSQEGGGHVVNVSTSLIDHANSRVPSALASLTKGGLTAVTKALATEYANRGIRVNAVALGIIRTPMYPPETHQALATLHPLGRIGEVGDVAEAIVYLENAPFVTGEIMHVDGGQSAGH